MVAFDTARGLAEIDVKNRFAIGDRLELVQPGGNHLIELAAMQDAAGATMPVAPGNGHRVWIPLPADSLGGFLTRFVQPLEQIPVAAASCGSGACASGGCESGA